MATITQIAPFTLTNFGVSNLYTGLVRMMPGPGWNYGGSCSSCCGTGEYLLLQFVDGLISTAFLVQGKNRNSVKLPLVLAPTVTGLYYNIQYLPGVPLEKESCECSSPVGEMVILAKDSSWADLHQSMKLPGQTGRDLASLNKKVLDLTQNLAALQTRYDTLWDATQGSQSQVDRLIGEILAQSC